MFATVLGQYSKSLYARLIVVLGGLMLTACSAHTPNAGRLVSYELTAPPTGAFELCLQTPEHCGLVSAQSEDDKTVGSDTKSLEDAPEDVITAQTASVTPELTEEQILMMARVINLSINAALTYRTDEEMWGQAERWVLPITQEGLSFGDCEDYALEKRVALIAAGVPAERLRLATAWSRMTGDHAVLILRLDDGDYVLDNTTPHIYNVADTAYRWDALQTGDSLLHWSSLQPGASASVRATAG